MRINSFTFDPAKTVFSFLALRAYRRGSKRAVLFTLLAATVNTPMTWRNS